MKKFAFGVLAVCMVVLLVVSLNGGFDDADNNKDIKFNEAAFSVPFSVSGSTDITHFLVGDFEGEDGSHISLDGEGSARRIAADGMVSSGSYSLVEQSNGGAMLRFVFADGEELYAFSIASENGEFILQDADGKVFKYSPIMI